MASSGARIPGKIIQMYSDMADSKTDLSIAIIYDTMWHSTELMTVPITEGIKDEGVDCVVIKLRATPMSVAIKEFWKARGCSGWNADYEQCDVPVDCRVLVSSRWITAQE